jgi:2-keto-4-pentenoate hydratase
LPGLAAQLPALRVELRKGETVVDRGLGANVLDSPLEALAFLVGVLARQADAPPFAAGEIVSTGTLTDAHPVTPGETWSTSFVGLPLAGLEVRFE